MKLVHENESLDGLKRSKEDLSKKYQEILGHEKEMSLLRPYCEKLPIYKEFKESLINLNKLKEDEKNNKETITQIEGYKALIDSEKENHERYIALEGEVKGLNNKKVG